MILNGKDVKYDEELTVLELLEKEDYDAKHVAVEINGEVVPERNYGTVIVSDSDTVQVAYFIIGG